MEWYREHLEKVNNDRTSELYYLFGVITSTLYDDWEDSATKVAEALEAIEMYNDYYNMK